jgi:hypothetical protein
MPRRPREMKAPSPELLASVRHRMAGASAHFLRVEALARIFIQWTARHHEALLRLRTDDGLPLTNAWIRALFLEARREGACRKTIENEREIVCKYAFTMASMPEVLDVIASSQYSSALRREAASETCQRQKMYPAMARMLDLTELPVSEADRHVQALWFVCCVTGNRPQNLYYAQFEVESDCLVVFFHNRKSGNMGREGLEFPWRWSGHPPDHIKAVLAEVRARYDLHPADVFRTGWRLHCSAEEHGPVVYQVASRINRFLQKHRVPWTSTTPRDVQATELALLVGRDPALPDRQTLEWLMDHTEATVRNHYMKRPGRRVDEMGRPLPAPNA